MFAPVSVRRRKIESGRSGAAERRSIATNATWRSAETRAARSSSPRPSRASCAVTTA